MVNSFQLRKKLIRTIKNLKRTQTKLKKKLKNGSQTRTIMKNERLTKKIVLLHVLVAMQFLTLIITPVMLFTVIGTSSLILLTFWYKNRVLLGM